MWKIEPPTRHNSLWTRQYWRHAQDTEVLATYGSARHHRDPSVLSSVSRFRFARLWARCGARCHIV
jgi:hypothetical protein